MIYAVSIGQGYYLCTGSYIVHGEKYQVIGDYPKARKFKTYDAAKNWADYLQRVRANVGTYIITNDIEQLKVGGVNERG